jgi:nucleoside-triphosphatase
MKDGPKKNILVTGKRGTGKTTLVREVVRALGVKPGGYRTEGFPQRGRKIRCEIVSLTDGLEPRRGILADIAIESPRRFCGMGVNIADLEAVGAAALEKALTVSPLIVMDEIGHMEVVSERFQSAVIACMDSATPVLGVIKIEHGPFVDRIKGRDDVELLELSLDTYGAAKRQVTEMLRAFLKG